MNFSSRKQYGFVAQELEEVLPELVQVSQQPVRVNAQGEREMEDVKSINYTELISILTKAIQEHDQKLNNQDKKIEELTKLVEQLTSLQIPTAMLNRDQTSVNASLEQNMPNPFNKTTTINYALPQKFINAQIVITDNNGKTLRQMNISCNGKGTVQINADALSAGAYNYSLVIDGVVISSKQMLLIK